MYLDLGAYERKDDRLEYDPHLLEDGGHRVIVAPARLPPLHRGHKGQNNGGQASGTLGNNQKSGSKFLTQVKLIA